MRLKNHISNDSNAFLSISFIIHVSQAILQTNVLMNLFLMLRFNFLDMNNFDFLLNSDFAILMCLLISIVSLPSDYIILSIGIHLLGQVYGFLDKHQQLYFGISGYKSVFLPFFIEFNFKSYKRLCNFVNNSL